jgi:DNA modification methylase
MIETGDCRDIMRRWIAGGVKAQTCVTSPPYWGLRDFGVSGQIGLESTPEEYIANMVEVFALVREVLAEDGTLWLNLGDSYATGAGGEGECPGGGKQGESWRLRGVMTPPNRLKLPGLKPKDLVGIPWRVAFALQADGWYLRSDIIWSKPNPMPESVTDRPTKAHEYLFLLAKRERYYYDAAAIREPGAVYRLNPNGQSRTNRKAASSAMWRSAGTACESVERGHDQSGAIYQDYARNRRTVWEIATQPYSDAHFATFPEALVEPCVLAGTSARGHCPACGKGWERQQERAFIPQSDVSRERGQRGAFDQKPMDASNGWQGFPRGTTRSNTIDWQPACACNLDPVPAVVLDPFMGSGTVARVATRLGRHHLGCELNPAYRELADTRTKVTMGLAL